jgi:uncharacterized protein YebE (UPF0316 family)
MTQGNINQILGVEETSNTSKDKSDVYKYRYPALRFISWLFWIFAVIIFIISIILGFNLLDNGDDIFALISFTVGIFFGLLFAATSEIIKVFVDIEYNTRKISEKNIT